MRSLLTILLLSGMAIATGGPTWPGAKTHAITPAQVRAQDEPKKSRRVFVPADELDAVLNKDRRGVILPREQFEQLLNKAGKPDGAPAGVVISDIEYKATIKDSQLLIDAQVRFEQFTAGWHSLALPASGLSVEAASIGETQPVLGRLNGKLMLLSNEPGKRTLKLKLSAQLAVVGSDQLAAFDLLPCSSATFEITVPAKKQLAQRGLMLERGAPVDQPATLKFPVGGTKRLELRLTERQRATRSEALVFATTAYGVNVAPSEITWQAVTTLQSFGESVSRFTFSVPRALEIAAVESTGLESWQLDDSADRTRTQITLTYRQPVDGSRRITFRGVMAVPVGQQWTLPGLRLANAASEVGRIVVRHPVGTRLVIEGLQGVRRTPDASRDKLARASFDIWQEDFDLQLRLQLREREVLTNASTILQVTENKASLKYLTSIECLNAPLFEAVVNVPADWEPTGITLNGRAARWLPGNTDDENTQALRVPFPKPLQPGAELKLQVFAEKTLAPGDAEIATVDVPQIAVEGAGVVEGIIMVQAAPWLRLTPGEMTGLDPTAIPNVTTQHLGFRYQTAEFQGAVTIQPRQTRLAAWTQSYTRLDPDKAMTWLDLHLTIEGGGLRELPIQLPESVGENLRFMIVRNCEPAARIREQTAAEPVDGVRAWTLRFDKRIRGDLTLSVPLEEGRGEDGNSIPTVRLTTADRQHGFVAVEASAEQRLTFEAQQAASLQPVDVIDLPASTYKPKERIVSAWRYVGGDSSLTVNEQRFDRQAVPTAVVNRMSLRTVLGKTGEMQHHVTAMFIAVGVQNLRLQLPEGSKLWSTEVDGGPVEVRRDGDAFLVPLREADIPDAERQLTLVYGSTTDSLTVLGRIRQSAPKLSVDIGGSVQPLNTLRRQWDVHHPAGTMLLNTSGQFEPIQDLDRGSLLAGLMSSVKLPNQTTAAEKLMMIGVAVLIALVATYVARRWGLLGLGIVGFVGWLLLLVMFSGNVSERTSSEYFVEAAKESPSSGSESGAVDDYAMPMEANESALPESKPTPAKPRAATVAPARDDFSRTVAGLSSPDAFTEDLPAGEAPAFGSRQLSLPQGANDRPDSGGQPGRYGRGQQMGERAAGPTARLSVSVPFDAPEGSSVTSFAYDGLGTSGADLEVAYHDHELAISARVAIALLIALVFWFSRNRSAGLRLLVVTVGLFLPIAALPIIPGLWQIAVEGALCGGVAGIALWMLPAIARQVRKLPVSRKDIARASLVLVAVAVGTPSVSAQSQKLAASDDPPIVVPYDGDALPAVAERVFLPHDQFLKLWRAANPEKAHANAPVDAVVSSAQYAAEVIANDGQPFVRVTGRFVLHNLRDRQSVVTLPVGEIAVSKATLNGNAAPLRSRSIKSAPARKGKNRAPAVSPTVLSVVLEDAGPAVLDVEFVVAARVTGPAGRFVVPLQPTPSAVFSFKVPAKDLQLRVNGSSTAWRTDAGEAIEFGVSNGGNATVEWQPKDEDSGVDRVIHADVTTAASFDDAGLHVRSQIAYRVRQGTLSEVRIRIPNDVVLQQVSGSDVGGWQRVEDGGQRSVRVFFQRAIDDSTSVSIELFQQPEIASDPKQLTIPQVVPTEVTRDTGQLAVFANSTLNLRAAAVSGGSQIETKDFATPKTFGIKLQPRLAWRYRVRPFTVAVNASRPVAELESQAAHAVFVEQRKVRYTSRFTLTPKRAPRARLAVVLPTDFLPLEVNATNLTDWYPYKDASGADVIIVDLAQPTLKPVELIVTGTIDREPGAATARIAVPFVADTQKAPAAIGIRTDKSYSASVATAGNWKSTDPQTLPSTIRGLSREPVRFAFVTDAQRPDAIELNLDKIPPTLFGESVSVINISDTSTEYSLNLKWIVRQSATDRFAFSGPDWLAGKVEVRANGLRQVIESEPQDGRVTWTLVLQEPRSDQYFALGVATFPATVAGQLRTPVLRCEPAAEGDNPIKVQEHFAIVMNQSQRLITEVGAARKAVSPDRLKIRIPKKYLDLATQIVSVPQDNPPAWTVTNPPRREAAPATVNLADLRMVVAADGSWRTKAVYTVRNRARQFLPVILPDDANLLSVFVKGKPARPVTTTWKERPLYLIALPRTSEADLSFPVEVVLAGQIDGIDAGGNPLGTNIQLPAPDILSARDNAEFGVPVAMTVWRVHVPDSWRATVSDQSGQTNMTLQDEEGSEVIRVMSSLKEAVEQSVSIVSSNDKYFEEKSPAPSSKKQIAAYQNLKRAEEQLEGSYEKLGDNREVTRELQSLRDNVSQLRSQLEQRGVTFSHDGTKIQGGIDRFADEVEGRNQLAIDFNKDIIVGNSAVSRSAEQFNELNFRFGLKNKSKDSAEKEDAKGKRQSSSQQRNRSNYKSLGNLNLQLLDNGRQGQQQAGQRFESVTRQTTPQRGAGAVPPTSGGQLSMPGDDPFTPLTGGGMSAGSVSVNGQPQGFDVSGAGRDALGGMFGRGGGGFSGGGGFGGGGGGGLGFGQEQGGAKPGQRQEMGEFYSVNGAVAGQFGSNATGQAEGQDEQDQSIVSAVAEPAAAWTRVGGLSLPIEIESDSTPINLSKPGGSPLLTLTVRPTRVVRTGYGLAWAIAWIVAAVALLVAFTRNREAGLMRTIPWLTAIAGLVGFLVLTAMASIVGFAVFALSLMWLVVINRATTEAVAD